MAVANNSDSFQIQELDFGRDSAESEQKFLQRVFLPTAFFERIRNGQKQLVLGRKGSGKTAVCLILFDNLSQQKATVSLLTPRDLSRFRMSMLERGSLNVAEAALLSWKYAFYMEIGLYILEAARRQFGTGSLTWPEPVRRVRTFMAANADGQANWVDRTFKIISGVRKFGLKVFEVELNVDPPVKEEVDFADRLDEITDSMGESIRLLFKNPIYILVDKVDEMWEPGEDSGALIIGLLRAAKELDDQMSLVKVIVFLRSDIFDSLRFHDKDKLHSQEERITWNDSDLKKVVAYRARASTGFSKSRWAYHKIWEAFFPAEIGAADSFDYMLQYTLMRPRDFIQLCNLSRDRAQDNNHRKIEVDDILEALPQYSEWKLQDLCDEYRVQYPFLEDIFRVVFYHTPRQLGREEILSLIEPVKDRLIEEFGDNYFDSPGKLLQILYDIGFLGGMVGQEIRYSFREEKIVVAHISEFEIHPAFRLALATQDPDQ